MCSCFQCHLLSVVPGVRGGRGGYLLLQHCCNTLQQFIFTFVALQGFSKSLYGFMMMLYPFLVIDSIVLHMALCAHEGFNKDRQHL